MDLTCRASTFAEHANLWLTPEYFPINMVPEANQLMFVPVSERLYQEACFLDDRELPTAGCMALPLDQAVQLANASPTRGRPLHGIFHIGFCGSTLISRCLDRLSGAMVLKEPYSFHDLADRRRHGAAGEAATETWRQHFDLLTSLLARTFRENQTAIIKPTDASTNLMGELLARSANARILFLYVGLEEFLLAMLGDDSRMRFVRDRLDDLASLFPDHSALRDRHALTAAEQAACLWWLHMRLYADFVDDNPGAACRSLDFGEFLRDPVGGLSAMARHFRIPSSVRELEDAIAAATKVHSKKPGVRFTAADRIGKQRDARMKYGREIRLGLDWAERQGASHHMPASPSMLPLEIG